MSGLRTGAVVLGVAAAAVGVTLLVTRQKRRDGGPESETPIQGRRSLPDVSPNALRKRAEEIGERVGAWIVNTVRGARTSFEARAEAMGMRPVGQAFEWERPEPLEPVPDTCQVVVAPFGIPVCRR